MPHPGPWTRAAIAAALLLTAGCSDTSGAEAEPKTDPASWSTSTDPVDTTGLVWASASVVHLADGTTIDVGGPMTTYVVAGDGVYFTPAESDEAGTEHGNMTTGPLRFADRDGEVTDTGVTVYVESLGSSPDGRYLGLVDATSGAGDRFSDYPLATAVVVDLSTGERVVDTTDGMGDPEEDDLAHDYPEISLTVRFPDATSAFVEGLDGNRLYSLPAGEGDPTEQGIRSPSDPTSPDGAWSIQDRGFDDLITSRGGEPVRIRAGTPRRDLRWWLDDSTVVGIAISGPGTAQDLGPDNTSTLVTCDLPDGACTPVAGTAGKRVSFPVGAGDEAIDLGAQGGRS
jgi:hypothetical protein